MEDFPLLQFERRHAGRRGEFIVRRHPDHEQTAARAIRRRTHPAWSQLLDEVRAA